MRLPDFWIFLPAFFLSLLGVLIIISIDPKELHSQILFIVLGIAVFWFLSSVDFSIFQAFSPLASISVIVLLVITLLFAEDIRGSRRWLSIGGVTIQATELVKPMLILFISFLSSRLDLKRITHFAAVLLLLALPIGLIFLQPDLGSTIMVTVIGGYSILSMKPKTKYIVGVLLILLICFPLLWHNLPAYQQHRMETFLNPHADPLGASYNQVQATIAVGSGQLLGKGLGKGTQSHLQFLPEKHTDFFFASAAEELGFIGSLAIILIFVMINGRLIFLAQNTDDSALQTVFLGVFIMIFFQAFIHIGINVGILPVTGLTLPFMSVGGSSMIANWTALGLASSASKEVRENRSIYLR